MTIKQTQMANRKWFENLKNTDPQKADELLAEYKQWSGNKFKKDLDLSVDGEAGSSTKFLIAARGKLIEVKADKPVHNEPKVPDIAKSAVEFADGQKLAVILNNNGIKTSDGENFSCQACIAMEGKNPEKVKLIATTIAKHGTPEQFSQVLRIYSSKPENLALAKAQWQAHEKEVATAAVVAASKTREQATATISDTDLAKYLQEKTGVAMTCQSCIKANADKKPQFIKAVLENNNSAYAAKLKEILPDEEMSLAVDTIKKGKVTGFAALQVTTQGKVDGVGQITATHGNAGVGVSFREGLDKPFLTRASIKDGKMEYGVLPVSVGRVDAITKGANSCPCSGNAEDGKLPTNINLPRNIKETGVAGVGYNAENIMVAAGIVTQSDMHKSGLPVALVETEHQISAKTKLLSSASVSPTQLHINAGTQTKVTKTLDVKTNAFYETGRVNQMGASATAIYSPNDKWTLAASAGVVHDKNTGKTYPEAGATIGRKISKNGYVEGFVATDIPKNKKDDIEVTGGVRLSFKF